MSVLLSHLIEKRDEMKKIRLDHLKQDQEMLMIKIFSKRKKILERERSVRKFMQRGLIFCKGWSSIYRQEDPTAAKAISLCGQLSVVEAADATKSNELIGLREKNLGLEEEKNVLSEKFVTLESVTVTEETELASLTAQVAKLTFDLFGFQLSPDELSSKVASLEFERDRLADQMSSLESAFELFKERMEAMQDEQAMTLANQVTKLDAQLLEMAAHLEEEYYTRFLTTISGRRVEDNVVLGETSLSFSLQVVHSRVQRVRRGIMKKRLSLTDVMVPLAEPLSSKSLIGEASTYIIPATAKPITTLSTTFVSSIVVPPLSVSDYQVLDAEPHDEDPHAVTFKEEELDMTPE
nr:hypothetical protein [Tanacetum cinerariifolium]